MGPGIKLQFQVAIEHRFLFSPPNIRQSWTLRRGQVCGTSAFGAGALARGSALWGKLGAADVPMRDPMALGLGSGWVDGQIQST